MPVISRPYHPYETHYSEEPLTSIDPDSPPPVLYESSRFENTLIQDSERKQVCNGEVISSGQPADSVALNLDGKGEETLLQREAANGVPDSSGDGSLISKNKETTESVSWMDGSSSFSVKSILVCTFTCNCFLTAHRVSTYM